MQLEGGGRMASAHESWRPRFHLSPRTGWLNDPNGLCQFRGYYHAFHQYDPAWPKAGKKGWGHFRSRDLLNWEDMGAALMPSIPEDADGVYSGSALIQGGAASDGGDLMRLYYTGNVKYEGDHIHTGRDANEIMVTSEDGENFSEKQVLLRPEDYPSDLTRHVRDPKVWEQDGRYYMVLGARRSDDVGGVLLYGSDDAERWELVRRIESERPFGYMWECPDVLRVDGHEFLSVSPQGLPSEPTRWQNIYQSGYFPLDGRLVDTEVVDESKFVELDFGPDFYAPQSFVDDSGRVILIGWMGMPDVDYSSAPDGLEWCHCLTLPRELSVGPDGLLRQWPVRELGLERISAQPISASAGAILPRHYADIVLEGIEGELHMSLDNDLTLDFADGMLVLGFSGKGGCGRDLRRCPLDSLSELRVIVDGSTVEAYANHGERVISTRWFPTADTLLVSLHTNCQKANAWEIGGMF
jgi:beta-fructofuranosidase